MHRRGPAGAVLLVVAFLVTSLAVAAGVGTGSARAEGVPPLLDDRPNVLLVTTDDMRADDLLAMPLTRALLGDGGVQPETGLATHPLCCPARAQLLTGQYAHHNGVRANDGVHGGYAALREPDRTLPQWLSEAGYRTGFVGKFLNGYREGDPAPAGWDDWHPFVRDTYAPYGVGVQDRFGVRTFPDVHSNDVVRDYTVGLVRELDLLRPFFLWSSYVSPHGTCSESRNCSDPPVPATRHRGLHAGSGNPAERSPAYADPAGSRFGPGVSGAVPTRGELRWAHRRRLEALASVDEGVAATLQALADLGRLDDTLVIFTSDNGYLLGEHGYEGKNVPYEEALRVPFLVRGPGLPAGVVRRGLTASLVDVAPTIAAAAEAPSTRTGPLDGINLLPVLAGRSAVPSWTQLLDIGPSRTFGTRDREWTLRGVRTSRWTYLSWTGSPRRQLFDRRADPGQLRNLARDRRYRSVARELDRRLRVLTSCRGASECHRDFGPLPPVG